MWGGAAFQQVTWLTALESWLKNYSFLRIVVEPWLSNTQKHGFHHVCMMVNEWVQWRIVVEYRTRNRQVAGSTHTRSTASNLKQVANLLCAQANSAFYLQRDEKWVAATATGWRPSVADWGDGVFASCTVGPIIR